MASGLIVPFRYSIPSQTPSGLLILAGALPFEAANHRCNDPTPLQAIKRHTLLIFQAIPSSLVLHYAWKSLPALIIHKAGSIVASVPRPLGRRLSNNHPPSPSSPGAHPSSFSSHLFLPASNDYNREHSGPHHRGLFDLDCAPPVSDPLALT